VNWYPQMSHGRVVAGPDGPVFRKTSGTADDLAGALRDVHVRTGRPVMITETSVRGRVRDRLRWLRELEAMVAEVRAEGLPLVGLTWFPAMSLLSWDYRRGRRPPEAYLTHFGLWDLRPDADGTLVRDRTPVADAWEAAVRSG
jgi:hypothetical protein